MSGHTGVPRELEKVVGPGEDGTENTKKTVGKSGGLLDQVGGEYRRTQKRGEANRRRNTVKRGRNTHLPTS